MMKGTFFSKSLRKAEAFMSGKLMPVKAEAIFMQAQRRLSCLLLFFCHQNMLKEMEEGLFDFHEPSSSWSLSGSALDWECNFLLRTCLTLHDWPFFHLLTMKAGSSSSRPSDLWCCCWREGEEHTHNNLQQNIKIPIEYSKEKKMHEKRATSLFFKMHKNEDSTLCKSWWSSLDITCN